MASNRLARIALGLVCVAAAGGGGYLATRQNVATPSASAASVLPAASVRPVQGTASAEPASTRSSEPAADPARAAAPTTAVVEGKTQRQARAGATPTEAPGQTSRAQDDAPAPDHSSPGAAPTAQISAQPTAQAAPAADPETLPATTADALQAEMPRAPEPSIRTFQELVVSADSVIGLRTEGLLTSDRARVEDRVEARVVRDVRVNGEIAIPAGTRALGTVVIVERGGRLRARARLGIRFQTLVLADGTRMPVSTETIYRDGDAPSNGSAAKIGGGAVAGAILGAIIGGGKGAAIGATTGAGAGAAAVMNGDRSAATFPVGSEVTARILSPITITVARE